MRAYLLTIILLVSCMGTSVIQNHEEQELTESPFVFKTDLSNENPIRGQTLSDIPTDVEAYYNSYYNMYEWYHLTDEIDILEGESFYFYFTASQDMIGAEYFISLDIIDQFWSFEPDLDLYLYDSNDNLVMSSETEGDDTEELQFWINQSEDYKIEVYAYEGDGKFDLYREVFSNPAPKIMVEELNVDDPYLHDISLIDACKTYDINGDDDDITYTWSVNGATDLLGSLLESSNSCELVLYNVESTEVILTVSDSYNEESTQTWNIDPKAPGFETNQLSNTQTIVGDDSVEFTFVNMGRTFNIPGGDGLSATIGLQYDILVEFDHSFSNQFEFDSSDSATQTLEVISASMDSNDVKYSFKPSLLVEIDYKNQSFDLPLPMLTNVESYEGQPQFSIADYEFDLYYWNEYVELDTSDLGALMSMGSLENFVLAEIDIFPVIEELIDLIGNSMGQAWVDTATDILGYFVDIEMPLSFEVDIFAYTEHLSLLKYDCTACEIEGQPYSLLHTVTPQDDLPPEERIQVSSTFEITPDSSNMDYTLTVVNSLMNYIYVEVQPQIDLGLVINDIKVLDLTVFEFDTLENEYLYYSVSDQKSEFMLAVDSDGDGYSNSVDAFPQDPTEWQDSDGDGYGDNSDVFPQDSTEWADTDSDGYGDNADVFPQDSTEWADTDSDGYGDNSDVFPQDSTEWADTDSDGYGDNADVFPQDASEWLDSDSDTYGDNSDAFPQDPTEWLDTDSDGYGDNSDEFPEDGSEWKDSDGDDTGDNSDVFPEDSTEWADTDLDGYGDNSDAFPQDVSEWEDSDNDGVGDNSDAFPQDSMESKDSDSDGVGDNEDAFPFNALETKDTDGDGVGDNSDVYPSDSSKSEEESGLPGFGFGLIMSALVLGLIFHRRD